MSDKTEKPKSYIINALSLVYTQVARPNKWSKWATTVVVDKAERKKFQKTYPNCAKKWKDMDADEFQEKYGIESPIPDDDVFVATFDQNTQVETKSGLLKFEQPKVYHKPSGSKKATDITNAKYVGNGSVGQVLLAHREVDGETGKMDVLALKAISVSELVEYEGGEGGGVDAASEFGFDEIEDGGDALKQQFEEPNETDDAPPFDTDEEDEEDY